MFSILELEPNLTTRSLKQIIAKFPRQKCESTRYHEIDSGAFTPVKFTPAFAHCATLKYIRRKKKREKKNKTERNEKRGGKNKRGPSMLSDLIVSPERDGFRNL